jgi:ribosomal protein S18 acetylase RimI-like enzyme
MDDAARSVGFLRDHAFRVSRRGPARRFTTAVLYEPLSRVWSLNYILGERDLEAATAEALAEEAEELLGGAGLSHRKIEVWDEAEGGRLAEEFRGLGWNAERDLIMVYRGPPDRGADTSIVEEVEAEALTPAWIDGMRPDFKSDDDVIGQLVEYKRLLAASAGARFFAARADGTFASFCDLYSDGHGTAQIEAVVTLERFRGQGLARAVVTSARLASEAGGHDLTFLLADDADWPKHLYEKLGFVRVGMVYDFTLRATSPI